MRVLDTGEAGTRVRHGETQRVTANSGVGSALAGELPVDGAAVVLSAAAPASDARSSLRQKKGKRGFRRNVGPRGNGLA